MGDRRVLARLKVGCSQRSTRAMLPTCICMPTSWTVSFETVRELVDEQFPEWRDVPIRSIASQGTVNAIFRIGDQFAARFPLQFRDVGSTRRWLESEADAARELVGRTRFPTPN
jgi:hypothetical protein